MSEKAETDTWYVLADGTHAHPADVEQGDDGVLKSKDGVPVALRDNGLPLTSGVATKSNRQAAKAGRKGGKEAAVASGSDAKAEPAGDDPQGAGYATRESKAD